MTGLTVLRPPMRSHYFAPFFMGMSEVSSVPLAVVDFFKHFKDLRAKFPIVNDAARQLFAAAFLALRSAYWPFVCYHFWRGSLAALSAGATFPMTAVIGAFCFSNILLTLLQWYWTSLILKAVIAKAKGQPDIDPDEMEGEKRQKKRL
jgi:hypothetical protein